MLDENQRRREISKILFSLIHQVGVLLDGDSADYVNNSQKDYWFSGNERYHLIEIWKYISKEVHSIKTGFPEYHDGGLWQHRFENYIVNRCEYPFDLFPAALAILRSAEGYITRCEDSSFIKIAPLFSKTKKKLYYLCKENGQFIQIIDGSIDYQLDDTNDLKSKHLPDNTTIMNNGLRITVPNDFSLKTKSYFRIIEFEEEHTKRIMLTKREASFLYYIALERRSNERGWLANPGDHLEELKYIARLYQLNDTYIKEIGEDTPENPNTWIWDFQNLERRKIVSNINIKTTQSEFQKFIIESVDYPHESIGGNYRLISSINYIQLSHFPEK